MSIDVLREVLNHSQAKGTDRLVLIALADAANPNGITWLPLSPPKAVGVDPTKCITHRANCSKREAIRAIQQLEQQGEVEVRKAQRGQRRISVYRVSVGTYAKASVDYENLPFELKEPFGRGDNLAPRNGADTASLSGADVTPRGDRPGTSRGDDLAPHGVTAFARARREPSLDPSEQPAAEPPSTTAGPLAARPAAPRTADQPVETAAASESEPVSLERAIASLATLTGWDAGSLGVVAPLLQQLPGIVFERTLQKVGARRAKNPVGLFVHLLRAAIDDWRRDQHEARLATWDAVFGEAGIERVKREDPERYVRAWAAPSLDAVRPLPPAAVISHVLDYLFEYVDDVGERFRLLEVFVQAAERQPAFVAIRDWILFALDRHRYSPDEVRAAVETLTGGEPELQQKLLAFADIVEQNVNDARRSVA